MTVNRKRLIELAVWVAGEDAKRRLGLPNEWRQGTYVKRLNCGTACCVAGKVALDDGCAPIWGGEYAANATTPDGRRVPIDVYAKEALGLGWAQAWSLFYSDNDLDDVLMIIGDILARDTPDRT